MLEISQTIQHLLVPILFTLCVIAIIFLISAYLRLVDARKELKRQSFFHTVSAQTIDDYEHQVKLQECKIAEQSKRLVEANAKIKSLTRPRDAKGHYLKSTGKGHGKKKTTTDRAKQPVERDWTQATKDELLAEAKRRYPAGTKIKCLHKTGFNDIETDNFEYDRYGHCIRHENGRGYVNCVYDDGKWAQIIKP